MANRARGETVINVPNVGEVTLCLTMAGMAALEDAFQADNLQEVTAKVGGATSSKSLATLLHALMIGGPQEGIATVEEMRRWPVTPSAITQAMSAMKATNEGDEGNAGQEPGNRQQRRAKRKG